jgi:Plasma-membrane choline transporter
MSRSKSMGRVTPCRRTDLLNQDKIGSEFHPTSDSFHESIIPLGLDRTLSCSWFPFKPLILLLTSTETMESIVFNERNQSDDGSTLKVPLMEPSGSLFPEAASPIVSVAPSSSEPQRGEAQPNVYRDVWAAVLFVIVQVAILVGGIREVPAVKGHAMGILGLVGISTIIALAMTILVLSVLMKFMESFLQLSIMLSMVGHLVVVIFCIWFRYYSALVTAMIFLLLSIYYVIRMQRRIPFAAANLRVALTAISLNGGILVYATAVTVVVHFVFGIFWLLTFMSQYHVREVCNNGTCDSQGSINPFILVALLFVLYWTKEVGKNVVHVTTAGVLGTYWFVPDDASTFWSPAIHDSYVRATTYSLGSICLGSLITSFLQTMRDVVHYLRHAQRRTTFGPSIILCILECMTGFLERVVSYFNKWAYVYIGLYGYDYISAGNKVMTLFLDRGWSTIINDQIVSRVLTLVSILIGLLSGCGGLLLSMAHPDWVRTFGDSASVAAFFLPALMGLGIAHIVMSVITSAVDTVVVAFAEAPLEFERNHPGLSSQLVTAWRHVYPDEFV